MHFYELVGVGGSPVLQPLHGSKVDDEHDEVVNADIVSVRVEPKRQNALIHHHSLNHQTSQLGDHCRPHQVLAISFWDHESCEGEEEGEDGAFDLGLGNGVFAGGVVKVEPAEGYSAGEEGEVVEIVVLVEAVGTVNELGIAVVALQHFVDEVEGRHAGQYKKH